MSKKKRECGAGKRDATTAPNGQGKNKKVDAAGKSPEVEKEDVDLEKIRQELRQFLADQEGTVGSERLRGAAEETPVFKHLSGVITEDELVFSELTELDLHCGEEVHTIQINDDTLDQMHRAHSGQEVHVIVREAYDKKRAMAICSGDFYQLFQAINNVQEKLSLMRGFLKLSERQQSDIREQLQQETHPLNELGNAAFRSRDELALKYKLCTYHYTPRQQRVIEELFDRPEGNRGKNLRKLQYLLNISSSYPGRKEMRRAEIFQALNSSIYKMDAVKERIATHLIASNYTNHRSLRLLLVGSPGGPQTCICRSVAECRGIPFEEVDMSGVENTIDVIGLDSSYDASDSGMFVKKFYQAGTSEMVICLKNINNMGTSEKDGNPAMALLNVISRDECYDAFLETSIDTSNTIWIATATCLDDVPPYLRSQFEVIAIGDPSDDDRVVIAERYIIPQILEKFRIQSELLNFRKEAIWEIIQQYCSDYGMKMATQNIEAIVTRILAMREDTEKNSPFTVTPEFVRSVLEPLFNEHDPALVFARNKERFSDTVRAEIKDLLNRLSSRVMKPEEKETLMRRIRYLTTLIPEDNGFGQFDGKRFFNRVDATHYGMEEAKRQIAHTLNAKALQKGSLSSVRFLLVGPAGTGKTSICKSLADSLSLPHIKISLNGVSDECALKGTSPAYLKADAGEPVRGLYHMGGGGVIQLDEVDKMGCHNGVKVSNTLLDLLDDSGEFTDRFLGVPIDIKNVLFIGTANDISGMEPWLLDRFTVIFLEGYTRKDKEHILTEYLIPRLEREYPDLRIAIRPAVVQSLVKDYCPSLGVRDLERAIRKLVEDKLYECPEEHNVQIESEDIIRCLGAKPLPRGNLLRKPVPGYAKALAVTGGGTGLTFSVESVILPGSDELCITGLAQESTVDSVKLAKTYIQTHYLDGDEFGLHLHFGEGAMEKDGPSGGIAILISIISAVFHTSITCNAAFTGEIDLFGNVFPVGGILAKIQAAELSGCTHVFIPQENYNRLSNEERERFSLRIIPVRHVSEVVETVLPHLVEAHRIKQFSRLQ